MAEGVPEAAGELAPPRLLAAWGAALVLAAGATVVGVVLADGLRCPTVLFPNGMVAVLSVAAAVLIIPRWPLRGALPPLLVVGVGEFLLLRALESMADYPPVHSTAHMPAAVTVAVGTAFAVALQMTRTPASRRRLAWSVVVAVTALWMVLTGYFTTVQSHAMGQVAAQLPQYLRGVALGDAGTVRWDWVNCRLTVRYPQCALSVASNTYEYNHPRRVEVRLRDVPVTWSGRVPDLPSLTLGSPPDEECDSAATKQARAPSLTLDWRPAPRTFAADQQVQPELLTSLGVLRRDFAARLAPARRGGNPETYRSQWHGLAVFCECWHDGVFLEFTGTYRP